MNNAAQPKEHVLACLSTSPSNRKILRTAAQMARAYDGKFTALYVKTGQILSPEDSKRLLDNIRYAEEEGAEIATVYGDDIAYQIAEYARFTGGTKIVLGRSRRTGLFNHSTPLTERLIRTAPGIEIHIIPDTLPKISQRAPVHRPKLPSLPQLGLTLLILFVATAVAALFHRMGFTESNLITAYLFGALLTALFTKNYICIGISSLAGVFLFNFFFTEPQLSMMAYATGYPVTLVIMFVSSLLIGALANRLALNARLSANAAYRTEVMLETGRLLRQAEGGGAILSILAEQLIKLLSRNVVIYPVTEENTLAVPTVYPVEPGDECRAMLTPQEETAARRVLESKKRADRPVNRFNDGLCPYFPLRSSGKIYAVVGIMTGAKPLEPFENSLLTSVLGEAALAIESRRNAEEKERYTLLAKNEQLRANLLRSVSHDLRTPLTSISGNAENLLINDGHLDEDTRRQLLTNIGEDARWLIAVVENLLSVTRISEGKMALRLSEELLDEVIPEALRHIKSQGDDHRIRVLPMEELLLARMDARLICQVIINLVDNAVKYTPAGSEITLSAEKQGAMIAVTVADNGSGIPDNQKKQVFQMFYTNENPVTDCRRSLGLGLALCESIVHLHGGTIALTDNEPHGAKFTFTLPASEVNLNE